MNYFTPQSIKKFFGHMGLTVVDMLGEFPLEQFIPMGFNYIKNPDLGAVIHRFRMNYEINMPLEMLIAHYRQLIQQGLGRDMNIVCRKNK